MELCNAIPSVVKSPAIPCLSSTNAYVRQPYNLSRSNSANFMPSSQLYPYPITSNEHICRQAEQSETNRLQYFNHDINTYQSTAQNVHSKCTKNFYQNVLSHSHSVENCGLHQGGEKVDYFKTTNTMDSWLEATKVNQVQMMSQVKNSLGSPNNEMMQHVQHLAQWDVNDPKLPKIRQYDPFTMWPQGNCRSAYQKSSSDGARRHASGWAMRNTNNHNAVILKKSCLGVLLCTSKRCSLAMRPAICDKARRRQEGRPCCIPNCSGKIYNQPCRGHGGYPVTHFWREHGDTVYFQSKGTHDHVRPDLKPVRDTAARRRRQIQMERSHRNTMTVADGVSANEASKRDGKLENEQMITTNRTHIPTSITEKSQLLSIQPIYAESESSSIQQAFGEHWKANLIDLKKYDTLASVKDSSAEPIFPGLLVPCTESGVGEYYPPPKLSPYTLEPTDSIKTEEKPTNELNTTERASQDMFPSPPLILPLSDYNSSSNGTNSFMKELYEQDLKPQLSSYYQTPNNQNKWSLLSQCQQAELLSNPFYRHQHSMHPFPFLANQTVGGNSESTSGGLNASWSTPSPPTLGNNSSLFGNSDFRSQLNGYDESACQNVIPISLNDELSATTANATWRSDPYLLKEEGEVTRTAADDGLVTPTHPCGRSSNSGSNSTQHSPENLITSSILMSASTPVSGFRQHRDDQQNMFYHLTNQLTQCAYYTPASYITPISSLQMHSSSDSQHTTQTNSTSNGSNGRLVIGTEFGGFDPVNE